MEREIPTLPYEQNDWQLTDTCENITFPQILLQVVKTLMSKYDIELG